MLFLYSPVCAVLQIAPTGEGGGGIVTPAKAKVRPIQGGERGSWRREDEESLSFHKIGPGKGFAGRKSRRTQR